MSNYGRFLGILLIAGLSRLNAEACLNDRDSDALALQAKKLPDTVRVITGRFPRNPPLYYEMRVDRTRAELAKNPKNWGLYDDVAVALGKLGKDSEALAWMDKKRSQLPRYDAKRPAIKEAWYRYYANHGTFLAHSWIHGGARRQDVAQLKQATVEIGRALNIKPNAHFGRERYQLFALEWLLINSASKTQISLSDYIDRRDKWEDNFGRGTMPRRQQAAEGLSGLVVLGAAWESPDVFEALSKSLDSEAGNGLSYLALLRCRELLKEGKKPLGGEAPEYIDAILEHGQMYGYYWGLNRSNGQLLKELYPDLRQEADQWLQHRQEFMLAKMRAGHHPDWDRTFWDGYQEREPPKLDVPWAPRLDGSFRGVWLTWPPSTRASLILMVGGTVLAVIWSAHRTWRRFARIRTAR